MSRDVWLIVHDGATVFVEDGPSAPTSWSAVVVWPQEDCEGGVGLGHGVSGETSRLDGP